MLDEYLEVFTIACGGGIHDYHGEHVVVRFGAVLPAVGAAAPLPDGQPAAPACRALRRGSRYDGVFRILTPVAEVKGIVDRMRAEAEQAGGDPEGVKLYDFQAIVITDDTDAVRGRHRSSAGRSRRASCSR